MSKMHVHVGAVEFLTVAAYIVVFGFIWRALAAKWSNKPIGQAMAFIY